MVSSFTRKPADFRRSSVMFKTFRSFRQKIFTSDISTNTKKKLFLPPEK
jgi:hypothetical protein